VFAGSACLFFHLVPPVAVLSDINIELMETYAQIKENASEVANLLSKKRKSKQEYYRLRSKNPTALTPQERAARFIYLNRCCFNGLYRTNLAGQFNVPYGGIGSGALPDYEWIASCSVALRNVELKTTDFQTTVASARQGDFVYLDPPFRVSERRVFRQYQAADFSSHDIRRLRLCVENLADKKVAFLLSYADCADATPLKKGFKVRKVTVQRSIAGSTDRRTKVNELLISYAP
jgi:DNA adenine methylase